MLVINGQIIDVPEPLLTVRLVDFLRDFLNLRGTKFGCGQGLCGACTIHVNGQSARSCQLQVQDVLDSKLTTIEGLASNESDLHPVQKAWIESAVPQCGYCQPGQIMSASALLAENPSPSDQEIDTHMSGNLCRCGTYPRIKQAIKTASRES
ncbi:2Fe-2S iron-sulfur cluster binding domain-containing protein [Sneathiella sp. P13V-1]|uniref:(2Fe-2S)-binding protein n=1 Tax=Sneathiella sp. P13V-1 TaxID=2697366 RepID=UPI00187BB735|nr:(2Fe-2S)-binding protein [Sneathiella sp. P13V-1]MBE7638210.1 2Fe-2S iron-sulfur cluster binding domain-containing protein [Sneathiella sp. P13V-1]